MSDYDTSGLDSGHDAGHDDGYDSGHDSGYDGGHEQHGLVAAHEAQGDEHDQFQHFQGYGESHESEHDEHFRNIHTVEYDDGKGGHYKVTDITVYDEHSETSDQVFAQDYTEANHDESYSDFDTLRERFVSELGEIGHGIGYGHGDEYDGGHQAISEASN